MVKCMPIHFFLAHAPQPLPSVTGPPTLIDCVSYCCRDHAHFSKASRRAVAWWQHRGAVQAFAAWREGATQQSIRAAGLHAALQHWQHKCLSPAFRQWASLAAALARNRQLLTRALASLQNRSQTSPRAWPDFLLLFTLVLVVCISPAS